MTESIYYRHHWTPEDRERLFWSKVDKRDPEECWPWLGYVAVNGYGQFGGNDCVTRLSHRIAYEYAVEPIPGGLVLDHLCHTRDCDKGNACPHRRCCNPRHLEPIPNRENVHRGRSGDSWGYVAVPSPAKPVQVTLAICRNGCAKPIYKRDLCRPCYRKWLKDPNVERPSHRTPEQRFWMKVDKTGPCWLWTASVNHKTGYAQFFRRHGQPVDGHRFSYELAHGSIPDKHDVHHACHVRRCVNPDHLEALPASRNRAIKKDRRRPAA